MMKSKELSVSWEETKGKNAVNIFIEDDVVMTITLVEILGQCGVDALGRAIGELVKCEPCATVN